MTTEIKTTSQNLLGDVRQIINEGKAQVAMTVNVALTDMYWHIGKRINDELHNERAEYGRQIVASLLRQLSWTHFIALIPIEDSLKRKFYTCCGISNQVA